MQTDEEQQDLPACLPAIASKAGIPGFPWSLAKLDSWAPVKGLMLALPRFSLERELLWWPPLSSY